MVGVQKQVYRHWASTLCQLTLTLTLLVVIRQHLSDSQSRITTTSYKIKILTKLFRQGLHMK